MTGAGVSKAGLDKTVKDAEFAGQEIARALVDTCSVQREMQELTAAVTNEVGKATGRIKMDMQALATASGQIRPAIHPMTKAMSDAAAATADLGGKSTSAASGLVTKLTPALSNLTSTAVGIPGPLGRVASLLLQFSAGGAVTVPVVVTLDGRVIAEVVGTRQLCGIPERRGTHRQLQDGELT